MNEMTEAQMEEIFMQALPDSLTLISSATRSLLSQRDLFLLIIKKLMTSSKVDSFTIGQDEADLLAKYNVTASLTDEETISVTLSYSVSLE